MPTRQERRRQERLAKKKGSKHFDKDGNELGVRPWATGIGKEKTYEMNVEMIQPWSVPVLKQPCLPMFFKR